MQQNKPARELLLELIARKLVQAIRMADSAETCEDAETARRTYLSACAQCRNLDVRHEFFKNSRGEFSVRFHSPRHGTQPAAQPAAQPKPAPWQQPHSAAAVAMAAAGAD